MNSATSRNFSRPFPSPPSTSALDTPSRCPGGHRTLAQLPLSASQLHIPSTTSPRDRFVSTSNKLIDFTRCLSATSPSSTGANFKANGANEIGNSVLPQFGMSNLSSIDVKLPIPRSELDSTPRRRLPRCSDIWQNVVRDTQDLDLDIFRSINCNNESRMTSNQSDDPDVLPCRELKPLLTFHNLHSLQLTGMMQSYQPIIWATCWLNPNLTYLHLEMALEPELWKDNNLRYDKIDEAWMYPTEVSSQSSLDETEYLGAHGSGIVHDEFGIGEYLDQHCIRLARLEIGQSHKVSLPRYLPIRRIYLMNFIVDSGPFERWFDPTHLAEIVFLPGCIDAGFKLPLSMTRKVRVNRADRQPLKVVRFELPMNNPRIIDISKNHDIRGEHAANGNIAPPGLKSKLSQILPRWGTRTRDIEESKEKKKEIDE